MNAANMGNAAGFGGKSETDPHKIGQQMTDEIWNKIKSKMTKEESTQMKSDGGLDQEEFKTMLAKAGLKPSPLSIQQFNLLDTNKNGKIEESEVKSKTEGEGNGEDYSLWDWLKKTATAIIGAVAGAGAAFILG